MLGIFSDVIPHDHKGMMGGHAPAQCRTVMGKFLGFVQARVSRFARP